MRSVVLHVPVCSLLGLLLVRLGSTGHGSSGHGGGGCRGGGGGGDGGGGGGGGGGGAGGGGGGSSGGGCWFARFNRFSYLVSSELLSFSESL